MGNILNLDKLVKDDKAVILDGDKYILPAGLPVKTALKMQKAYDDLNGEGNDLEKIQKGYEVLYEVFLIKNKNFMSLEDFMELINLDQFIMLCNYISGVEVETEEENNDGDKKKGQKE